MPVRHDAPLRIAQVHLRQAVVEGRTGTDLLVGKHGADPVVIEVGKERQKVESAITGRVRRQIIRCQIRQVGPVVGASTCLA